MNNYIEADLSCRRLGECYDLRIIDIFPAFFNSEDA